VQITVERAFRGDVTLQDPEIRLQTAPESNDPLRRYDCKGGETCEQNNSRLFQDQSWIAPVFWTRSDGY
jgi:hypothetical protein